MYKRLLCLRHMANLSKNQLINVHRHHLTISLLHPHSSDDVTKAQ
jgi:hypothetical protein